MNLTDITTLLLYFEDTKKAGSPSVTKHANQKPSGQCFGGNQGNSSSRAVPMELGHMKPQDKSRKALSKVNCYNCSQMGHYTKDSSSRKRGNLSHIDNTRGTSDSTDITQ